MIMPVIDNSLILFFAWKATRESGGNDGLFNSAGFATAIQDALGLPLLDGIVVRLILTDRYRIEQVGEAHRRLLKND